MKGRPFDPNEAEHTTPVALVTGASRGLGEASALALAKAGFRVVVNFLHSATLAGDVAKRSGSGSFAVRADISDSVQTLRMMEAIEAQAGRLDIVINNAGITRDNLLLRQSEDEWDEICGINLKGCFNVTRTSVPLLQKSGGGHIINISSYSGLKGKAGQSAYSASKAAILGLTFTSAIELAQHSIRVNALLPGYLSTGMGAGAAAALEKARGASVLRVLSSAAEAAQFIVTLAKTEKITGQVFSLDSRIV